MILARKLQLNKEQTKINSRRFLFQDHQSSQTRKKDSHFQDQDNIIIIGTKYKKDRVLTKIKIKDLINLFKINKITKNMHFQAQSQDS